MLSQRKPRGAALDWTDEELDVLTSPEAMQVLTDEAAADFENEGGEDLLEAEAEE